MALAGREERAGQARRPCHHSCSVYDVSRVQNRVGPIVCRNLGRSCKIRITQLAREGSPPPGLRLPQAKLSRKSNQVARGRIRRFESYMPSQPVRLHCVTEDGRTKTARYRVVSRWQGGFQKGVDQHRVDERMPQQFHQRCRAGVTGHNVRLWQPTFNDSCSSASRPRFYLPPQVTRYGPGFKIKRSGCRSTARARSRLRWLRR